MLFAPSTLGLVEFFCCVGRRGSQISKNESEKRSSLSEGNQDENRQ